MKKLVKGLVSIALALSLAACTNNTNVSTKANKEDFYEIFTDKEKGSGFYSNSFVAYDFSLQQFGKTRVYLDTSDGHKFELVGEEGGFNILDKKGNAVLYARAMNDEAYEEFSNEATQEKIFNSRTFKFNKNTGGALDAFTHLADVGIDCGMVFETHGEDESVFSLIAFRGDPIEKGSVSKKGAKKEEKKTSKKTDASTNTSLTEDVQKMIEALETDYSKVKWGVQYSISEDYPGFVISATPAYDGYSYYLVVGMTNLYDHEMSFSATVQAKNKSDKVIGDNYIYESAIGSGNTAIKVIYCGEEMPDGRIHWEEVELKEATSKYIAWEADYGVKKDDYSLIAKYEIYSANKEDLPECEVVGLLLDESGYVIGTGTDYIDHETKAGSKSSGEINFYGSEEVLSSVKDLALFGNPVKR